MIIELDDTAETRAVFEALKGGQHLSWDNDGRALWDQYRNRADQWRSLFSLMGYELREEHDSYCYLTGEGQASASTRMAVFLLVLVRALLRQGEEPLPALLERTWTPTAYPHLVDDRSREIMRVAGMNTATDIERVEQQLVRHGFAIRFQTGLRFCQPVRRIIDLCLEAAHQANDVEAQAHTQKFSGEAGYEAAVLQTGDAVTINDMDRVQ